MRVLITGATGSVGRALARVLRREGHEVIGAVRSVRRAANMLGPEIELVDIADVGAMRDAVERVDAVVNLAGEPIADRSWSERRKRALVESRVALTRRLSELIRAAKSAPRVLVSASAIGFYPDAGESLQDELAKGGNDFLGRLCADWEDAALQSRSAQTRVVLLRIGVVLDAESGALAKLLPLFRLGLGGRLDSGRQYFSWIHLDDLLRIILFALSSDSLRGVLNATAPRPISNGELTRTIAMRLGRPAQLAIPAFALRLAMGSRAELMLKSQRVVPRALERAGYRFLYPALDGALREILSRERDSSRIEGWTRAPEGREPHGATHVLTQVTQLEAPLHEVFSFFSRAQNLGWITPAWMGFAIVGTAPAEIREGTRIEYDIRLGALPLRWRTRIAAYEEDKLFVDNQEAGPYRLWWHEHRFEPSEGGTKMVDRVLLRLPLGPLGNFLAGALVRSTLRRIFAYRAQAMAQRFGSANAAERQVRRGNAGSARHSVGRQVSYAPANGGPQRP